MSTPSSSSSSPQKRRKRRSRSHRSTSPVVRFWREWKVEILIAFLILLAVFLLVERMNIRQALYAGLAGLFGRLDQLISNASRGLMRFVRGTTLSDLVAYLLLVVVVGLAVWRTRHRLLTHPRLTETVCPLCGGDLARIPRRRRDRLLNSFIPIRRYQCRNHECRWKGPRVRRSEHP
jgi:hypothetical protein